MSDDTERSVASAGSQPVAWANEDDDGTYEVGLSEAHAHYVLERAANGKYSHRNPRIVPLYREPKPTLTDEERAFFVLHMERLVWWGHSCPVSRKELETVRGLFERLS
jgi:hypothetical protein